MTQSIPTKLGIVFSGGGGKGAYEIGVWKALKEFKIDTQIEAVAGTSVGGLNGALFVQGDYDKAESLWLNISPDKVMSLNTDQLYRNIALTAGSLLTPAILAKVVLTITQLNKFQGLFSPVGLSQLIEQSNATKSVSNALLPFTVCALNSKTKKLEYPQLNGLNAEEITDWMLASSAIPLIFDGVIINQKTYFDGGVLPSPYSDNTPFKPLIEEQGCTHIIAIYLQRTPELMAAQKEHPQVNFWNVVPTQEFDGMISSLNFTAENAAKLIEQGYQDVKVILEQFKAFQDDEARYLEAVFKLSDSDQNFKQSINVNQQLRNPTESKGSLDEILQQLSQSLEQKEQEQFDLC